MWSTSCYCFIRVSALEHGLMFHFHERFMFFFTYSL
uniref:Uncharacterized protein n=1 Tax=Anguilla anguilla TaxID=7936 RepID=A0A0E9Q5M4_ANGAN